MPPPRRTMPDRLRRHVKIQKPREEQKEDNNDDATVQGVISFA